MYTLVTQKRQMNFPKVVGETTVPKMELGASILRGSSEGQLDRGEEKKGKRRIEKR